MKPRPLRVLIADDERMARQRLRRLLSAMADVAIVAECCDGQEVLEHLDRVAVDVALLDIHMPRGSGLCVADAAADWGVEIILATAHPEHAVEAFEQGVVDYVLKPVEQERLAVAITRAKQRMRRRSTSPSDRSDAPVHRMAFTVRGEVVLVDPAEITHALLDGQLVTVFAAGEALLAEWSLTELERKLPADQFARVHRRALVNLARVRRLKPLPSGGYLAVMSDGRQAPVSRQAARALRKRLGIV